MSLRVDHVLQELRRWPRFTRNVATWRRMPARPAEYGPLPAGLHPQLATGLCQRGIPQLYSHQAMAVSAALQGRNVVIVTPTASGKSLCYILPILDVLARDPSSTALLLFPTKALAHDQLDELARWMDASGLGLPVHTYDGDTPPHLRARVRREARVLLTNPDMLHVGMLPHHTEWAALFSGLRYVVVDEIHTYRGVFGSQVANVLRRLRRVCQFHGSQPQFITTSATIANPLAHAERLVQAPAMLVDRNGAPQGCKHFILYNPPVVDSRLGIRRSAVLEAGMIARRLLASGLQTIVFTQGRLTTEVLLRYMRDDTDQTVSSYRGGYLPAERREIEHGLREGAIRGVVATNALELGVDIGDLAACVMAGYPGTIASTWQQAGRAGRTTDTSVAVLVAAASPLDQYLMRHPQFFFGRSPEHALVNPDNLMILLGQLQCAAFELPLTTQETYGDAAVKDGLLTFLHEQGKLQLSGRGPKARYHWIGEGYPASDVSLRTSTSDRFLVQASDGAAEHVIGTVDRLSVPLLLYEGAIYLHQGLQYLVDDLDWDSRQAHVCPVDVDYYTQPNLSESIQILATLEEARSRALDTGYGEVSVTQRAVSFRQVRFYTHETLGRQRIDLPEQTLATTAYWLRLRQSAVDQLVDEGVLQPRPGDRGPNWTQQRDLARQRDGYRCQYCGQPEPPGCQHEVHHLRPFRSFDWRPGQNDSYLVANALENLVTLCTTCHRRAELSQRTHGVLAGLAHILRDVAPLFLMCDRGDIGVLAESRAADTGQPTLYVYDRAPAGLGFSQELFAQQYRLLQAARDVVASCPCDEGCPACVGPAGEHGAGVKADTARLLQVLA